MIRWLLPKEVSLQIRNWKLRNFPAAAPLLQDSCQDGQGELIFERLSWYLAPEKVAVYTLTYIYIYMKSTNYYYICDTYGIYIYIFVYS